MFAIILFYLFASLALYIILAGADFGAGILELFSAKRFLQRHQHLTYTAIGPVWEANHIWLILIIVILFSVFPPVYAVISTYLHIPLLLMLVGIIFRGTAFAFRHYDAIKDGSQRYYSALFTYSSFLTPLFLGTVAGASMLGRIDPQAGSFYAAFVAPWLNGFSFSVGLLFCGISAFAAAVFLVGESTEKLDRLRFLRMAKWAQIALVLLGGLVFVCAWLDGLPLLRLYLQHPLALISVALATLAVPLLWWSLYQGRYWLARFTAAFQIGMILLGWVAVQYPVMVHLRGQQGLSLMEALASEQVQFYAVLALLAGSALIFPALYYLFRVFKLQDSPRPS